MVSWTADRLFNIVNIARCFQFSGLFPVEVHEEDYTRKTDVKTKLSKQFLVLTLLLLVVFAHHYLLTYNFVLTFHKSPVITSSTFLSSIWPFIAFVMALALARKINLCFLKGHQVLSSTDRKPSMFSCSWVISGFLFHFVVYLVLLATTLFSATRYNKWFVVVSYFFTELPPVVIMVVVSLLLLIIETVIADINQTILDSANDKFNQTTFSAEELKRLARKHWKAGDLLLSINSTFGLHVFFFIGFNMLKLATFLYFFFIGSLDRAKNDNLSLLSKGLLGSAKQVLNNLILSNRAHRVEREISKTVSILNRLHRRKFDYLTKSAKLQIQVFKYQVKARPLHLSAAGFYNVNNACFFEFVVQVFTYFLILTQFEPVIVA